MMRIAVLGASGYAGGELIKLLDMHPEFAAVRLGAHSQAGQPLRNVHPHLAGGDRPLEVLDGHLGDVDLAFLALPHGASARIGSEFLASGVKVVDLGSDFRLDTPARYESAYGTAHPLPEELGNWVYALPELFGDRLPQATAAAAPGCYPTASLLAVAPLLKAGAISHDNIIINALSGVSGAGRTLRDDLLFGAVDEGVRAYGVTKHRHRPEIEMGLESYAGLRRPVTFTPHLVPMQRGILATVTAPAAQGVTESDLRGVLLEFADPLPFVEVIDVPPQTRWVVGSNRALLSAYLDGASGQAIVMCAIDNLVKGAAGQAIQAANLMVGLPETLGLPMSGWMP
ncbi:MAG: N-acetyl-gamma-glutamyl-phosphate reductase [Acidimicrobiia bacterium]|nr:N-acetyl-gamma-glutamyl-phosphate reductase [Acidimicrobiia bacterium]